MKHGGGSIVLRGWFAGKGNWCTSENRSASLYSWKEWWGRKVLDISRDNGHHHSDKVAVLEWPLTGISQTICILLLIFEGFKGLFYHLLTNQILELWNLPRPSENNRIHQNCSLVPWVTMSLKYFSHCSGDAALVLGRATQTKSPVQKLSKRRKSHGIVAKTATSNYPGPENSTFHPATAKNKRSLFKGQPGWERLVPSLASAHQLYPPFSILSGIWRPGAFPAQSGTPRRPRRVT